MQIVEATADVNVLDAEGRPAYHVVRGWQYLVHDQEAGLGMRQAALKWVAGLDRSLPCYQGHSLSRDRLILPFIGRKGDAVVTSSCLAALRERYPEITIDICTPESCRGVFELFRGVGRLIPYPLERKGLDSYDYYLSFEAVDAIRDGAHRSCADLFSACLKTPVPNGPAEVIVPPDVQERWRWLSSDRRSVAVHVGRGGSLRSYPSDLQRELVRRLTDDSLNVFLVGDDADARRALGPMGDRVVDLVDRTETCADLAAVLSWSDVVVTGDSFPLHLAGAMQVPTVAVFTATDVAIAGDYPRVTAVGSKAECSPCLAAEGPCPLKHPECVAFRDPSVEPSVLAGCVRTALGAAMSAPSMLI